LFREKSTTLFIGERINQGKSINMTQLLLDIQDESKTNKLLEFLKTLNYVRVHQLSEENVIVSESEKNVMRERLKNSKAEDFKDWDDIMHSFDLSE
jgi:hypothetical protein